MEYLHPVELLVLFKSMIQWCKLTGGPWATFAHVEAALRGVEDWIRKWRAAACRKTAREAIMMEWIRCYKTMIWTKTFMKQWC